MYRAVINVMIEVHPVKDGKCTGQIVPENEMANLKLSNNMLLTIEGATKNDCLTKLKEWINHAK